MLKLTICTGLALLVGLGGAANAQDICDLVLKEQAFDRSSSNVRLDVALATRDDLCSRDYRSEGEAQASARNAGLSFRYGNYDGAGSTGKQSSNSRWDVSESSLCTASASDFRQAYSGEFASTIASIAVNAWLECVTSGTRNQLYVDYLTSRDGSRFSGNLHTTARQGSLVRKITGISAVGPGRQTVRCDIGGKEYTPADVLQNPVVLESTSTTLACWRTGEEAAEVAFQTSEIGTPFIALPSQSEIEQTEIGALAQRIQSIEQLVDDRNGIEILQKETYTGDRANSIYNVDLEQSGLLLISGYVQSGRNSTVANAGVYLFILVDGQSCASDLSFEGESASIMFYSAGSCIVPLEPGPHTIEFRRNDHSGITEGHLTHFNWQILALR